MKILQTCCIKKKKKDLNLSIFLKAIQEKNTQSVIAENFGISKEQVKSLIYLIKLKTM